MKLHFSPETDSLYVEPKAGPGTETREIAGPTRDIELVNLVLYD